jgi:Leucine-rich repeat (LRR) protein
MEGNHFNKLPNELLSKLFDYLNYEDMLVFAQVLDELNPHHGKEVLEQYMKKHKLIHITDIRELMASDLKDYRFVICKSSGYQGIQQDDTISVSTEKLSQIMHCLFGSIHVKLNNFDINFLPENISYLKYVEQLDLYGNRLTSLPEKIIDLSVLETLNLSGNNFTIFPEVVCQLKRLRFLDLSKNHLIFLPNINMPKLFSLDVSHNEIKFLPTNLITPKLAMLYLEYNKLQSLPKYLGDFSNLKHLDVSYNYLRSLPNSLSKLTNLGFLNASFKDLEYIPSGVGTLPKFTTTSIFQTYNSYQEMIRGAHNERLFLNNNDLHTLPEDFKYIKDGVLYVRNNHISDSEKIRLKNLGIKF